jgi:hypothetical protein
MGGAAPTSRKPWLVRAAGAVARRVHRSKLQHEAQVQLPSSSCTTPRSSSCSTTSSIQCTARGAALAHTIPHHQDKDLLQATQWTAVQEQHPLCWPHAAVLEEHDAPTVHELEVATATAAHTSGMFAGRGSQACLQPGVAAGRTVSRTCAAVALGLCGRYQRFNAILPHATERIYTDPGNQVKASCTPSMQCWTRRDPPRPPGAPSGLSMLASRPACRASPSLTCRRNGLQDSMHGISPGLQLHTAAALHRQPVQQGFCALVTYARGCQAQQPRAEKSFAVEAGAYAALLPAHSPKALSRQFPGTAADRASRCQCASVTKLFGVVKLLTICSTYPGC